MNIPWIIKNSKIVYEDPWMKLRVDENEFQNGKTGQHAVILKRPFTTILPLKGNNIVMVSQIRYATGLLSLELPMGYMEEEDPLAGAKRELQEETGYIGATWTYLGKQYVAPAYCDQIYHAFIADNLELHEKNQEDTEFLEIQEVPFQKALDLIENCTITDSPTILTILRAKTYILDRK